MAQQEESYRKNKRHQELLSDFNAGLIPTTKVAWHENFSEIDLSLQRDRLHPKLIAEGLTVLNDVNLKKLIDGMNEDNRAMFTKKKLYNPAFNDRTISTVWDFWLTDQKLIPPTILIFDQPYIELLCPGAIESVELQPADGKHRLNVAYFFNSDPIPIVVLERQFELVKKKLGMH